MEYKPTYALMIFMTRLIDRRGTTIGGGFLPFAEHPPKSGSDTSTPSLLLRTRTAHCVRVDCARPGLTRARCRMVLGMMFPIAGQG